jgi:hypothetical protein
MINRRHFLYGTSAGVALFQIAPASVLSGAEGLSPNAKINVAGIGIGSQGGADLDGVAGEGHNLVALCDVDDNYAAKKFAKYPRPNGSKIFASCSTRWARKSTRWSSARRITRTPSLPWRP